ncbi:hypothetical protein E4U39_004303 [Claviceps sp. Clav50 group G5]|nr:hypothetical protein E4U39_004303 [Claviceps sp. Clav50 group G5]
MTDLLTILPTFPQAAFAALLPVIEQHRLSTTDLLALHPADIAKQTRLPLLDLKRFIAAVQVSLSDDLVPREPLRELATRHGEVNQGVQPDVNPGESVVAAAVAEEADEAEATERQQKGNEQEEGAEQGENGVKREKQEEMRSESSSILPPPSRISTLDPLLDAPLAGGIPTSSITEITGESGAGKTQLLLTLCLAVQLPPPHGLSKQALYISTESGLATRRLAQMLSSHPLLQQANDDSDATPSSRLRPSLDNILSTVTPDLESQDHILEYQVPVLLARHNIGLLVIDSVAANYRAEFERGDHGPTSSTSSSSYAANMAARSAALVRLGALLRDLARRHDIAVVVANQVADRFPSSVLRQPLTPVGATRGGKGRAGAIQDSPLASRNKPPPPSAPQSTPHSSSPSPSSSPPSLPPPPFFPPTDDQPLAHPALRLDHQQRWFTGWGDDPRSNRALKTPSLGLVWSTQISCRIVLLKRPVYGRPRQMIAPMEADDGVEVGATLRNWRRWLKVVFASHAAASGPELANATEFEVFAGGLRGVQSRK